MLSDFLEKFPGSLEEFLQVFEMLDQGSTVDLTDLESNDARVILEHFLGLMDVPSFGASFQKKPGDADSLKDFVKQIGELGYGQLKSMLPGGGEDDDDGEGDFAGVDSEGVESEELNGEPQSDDSDKDQSKSIPTGETRKSPKIAGKQKATTWEQVTMASREDRIQILKGLPKDSVFDRIKAQRQAQVAPPPTRQASSKGTDNVNPVTPPPAPIPLHTLIVQSPASVLGNTHPSISRYTGI